MENKLLCKSVMLPGEGPIKFQPIFNNYYLSSYPLKEGLVPQHLYLISDEMIKEGDWGLNIYDQRIDKCIKSNKESIQEHWRRIEATTDKSSGLPLIPQSFIEEYVQKQGKIDKVYIQLEIVNLPDPHTEEWRPKSRLKLTPFPYNEVIILPVKDNFTREEVEDEILQFVLDIYYNAGAIDSDGKLKKKINEWFDKNHYYEKENI